LLGGSGSPKDCLIVARCTCLCEDVPGSFPSHIRSRDYNAAVERRSRQQKPNPTAPTRPPLNGRYQAREALRRSEELMRAVLDTAADAIITIDQRGIIRSTNHATEHLFGYRAAELAGQNINRLMPEPFHAEHDGYIRNYCRTGRAKIIGIGREVTGQRKDGTTFPMHLSVSEVQLQEERLFTGIVHDLTDRRRLERQIMEAAANEQRRIGQDLHDGLCQDLIGIAFGLDAAARTAPNEGEKESLQRLAASVRDAAGQARRLAHGLNPVDLKAGGLAVALENLAKKVAESFKIRCTFHWDHHAHAREDAVATHLYRIAQEAVSNAIRHGEATRVRISLAGRGGALALSIADNGKGMPEAAVDTVRQGLTLRGRDRLPPPGMGLQTMHYRARVIGGTFVVASRKGGGTIITCTVGPQSSTAPDRPTAPGRPTAPRRPTAPAKRHPTKPNHSPRPGGPGQTSDPPSGKIRRRKPAPPR
jgi:PAS domain S-box-containing protein